MGVYIKEMEMPRTCAYCSFREVRYDPGYYNYEKCKALGKIFNECRLDIDPYEERLDDCPLIEIPTPHGRLIDADELRMECYHTMDELMKLTTMDMSAEALSLLCGFTMIGEAPTILEAEK